jgi:hypothetical protein
MSNPQLAALDPARLHSTTLDDLSYSHDDTTTWCFPSPSVDRVFPRGLICVLGVVLPVEEVRGGEPSASSIFAAVRAVCLPSTVERLRPYCFASNPFLSAVTFEAGSRISSIEECAFTKCSSLSSFFVPSSVEDLTGVYECRSLSAVIFEPGSRLSRIPPCAFSQCSSLSSICIPSAVQRLGGFCFLDCRSLSVVTFAPDSQLATIDMFAFSRCAIGFLLLPSAIREFDPLAISDTHLKEISVQEGNRVFKVVEHFRMDFHRTSIKRFFGMTLK